MKATVQQPHFTWAATHLGTSRSFHSTSQGLQTTTEEEEREKGIK